MFSNHKSFRRLALVGALGLIGFTTACDPYPAADTSKPKIVAVTATDGANPQLITNDKNNASQATVDPAATLDAAGTTAVLPLDDYQIKCPDKTKHTSPAGALSSVYVQFNKVIDGSTVEVQDPTTFACLSPASTMKATRTTGGVSTDVTAGTSICYNPNSPDLGSYVVVTSPDVDPDPTDPNAPPPAFWLANSTYVVTGAIKDQQKQALNISVTIRTPATLPADRCPKVPLKPKT